MNVPKENILEKVRDLLPQRPMSLGEAFLVADRQAALLRRLLKMRKTPIDIFRITDIPGVTVDLKPRYLMPDLAGHTRSSSVGHAITITQGDSRGRRRFTLGHEFKHVLDDQRADFVYSSLGLGDEEVQGRLVERVCDHFAATFLMPSTIVHRAWASGLREPEALAQIFEVSTSAMILRLRYLGFTTDEPQPTRDYFKPVALSQLAPKTSAHAPIFASGRLLLCRGCAV